MVQKYAFFIEITKAFVDFNAIIASLLKQVHQLLVPNFPYISPNLKHSKESHNPHRLPSWRFYKM